MPDSKSKATLPIHAAIAEAVRQSLAVNLVSHGASVDCTGSLTLAHANVDLAGMATAAAASALFALSNHSETALDCRDGLRELAEQILTLETKRAAPNAE